MYLVSAYFDPVSTKRLQAWIAQIAAASGNHYMLEKQVPPHLTLSAVEARSADVLTPALRPLEGRLCRGAVQFVTVGQLFPYVLYTMPVLNAYLQDLSLAVSAAVSGIPETAVSRYYRPHSWLPHVTLAKTLSPEQMRLAFAVVQENFAVFQAQVTELGLAKVNPHDDVLRFELRASKPARKP